MLLPGLTVEDLKYGVSQIRNPVIARIFRELELIEQWGSGIPGIFNEARANNWPEPEIEEIANRVRFTVKLPKILPLTKDQSRKSAGQVTGQVTGQVESLLKVVSGEKTKKELMQLLSLSGRDNFEKLYLKPAIELELLELTIPDKPNSRLQKYRLTELGKQILESKK